MEERLYDLIYIVRPATPEEETKKVIASVEHVCAEKGGKIEKTEYWGTRKLAYKVKKHREGIYVYQQCARPWRLVQEIERRLGVLDAVIKYQTVRLDEDIKLQKKLRTSARFARRAVRGARRLRRPRRHLRLHLRRPSSPLPAS